MKWLYQECYFNWCMWAIGWHYKDNQGWLYDDLTIAVGPIRFDFIRDVEVNDGKAG